MPMNFNWEYFWSYYQRIGYDEVRENMREEVLADSWLFNQPSEAQVDVLTHAPKDFIESIRASLKPDTLKILSPESNLIDWKKI